MDLKFLKSSITIIIICTLTFIVKSDENVYSDTMEGVLHGNGGLSEAQQRLILAFHNHYRANVYPTAANMQKLTWDDNLENITTMYVQKCQLAHNKQRHQLYERLTNMDSIKENNGQQHTWVGENIAWGSGSCTRPNGTTFQCGDIFEGIKRWLLQSKNYNYSTSKCSDKCSLYTQLIWAETNKLGCAANKCDGDKTILICNYAPGGNTPETKPYISGPPCSSCATTHSNCEKALCVSDTNASKKVEITQNSDSYPSKLYDCQDHSYLYSSSDSMINLESYNDNLSPIKFETPSEAVVDIYTLCYDIIWAITTNNSLLARYMKKYSHWTEMTVPSSIKMVSCANNQIVWILTTNGNIYVRHLSEISKMNNYDWWKLPNGIEVFKSITCGDNNCWGITNNNETFSRSNINKENPFGNYWKPESIPLQNITSNKKNILIGTTTDNKFRFKLVPAGANWNALSKNSINNLAFCADGVVELSEEHHDFKKTSNEDFFDIKMNFPVAHIDTPRKLVNIVTTGEDITLFNKLPFKVKDDIKVTEQNQNQNNETHNASLETTTTTTTSTTTITTTTPSPAILNEIDSNKKHEINSYEGGFMSNGGGSAIPRLVPIIPLLPQNNEPPPNITPEFHFLDGYKQFENFQSIPSNINSPSCCSLPDSVCPNLSHGCDAYIECRGHHPVSKRCEIGNVFDPTMNICVSKDQTHFLCEAPIVYDANTNPTTVVPTLSPIIPSAKIYEPTQLEDIEPIQMEQIDPIKIEEIALTPIIVQPIIENYTTPNPAFLNPLIRAISNDVKWRDLEINPHDDYIQPRVSIDKNVSNFGVLREAWFNLGTSPNLDYLYNSSRYPDSPDEFLILDSFEAPPNAGDGYGQRLSTYFRPNLSGEFTFYMSCDSECELRLSEDETENNLNLIISLRRGHYSSFRETKKYPKIQKSKPVALKTNKIFLLQAAMKESTVVDHLSVSIQYPNGFIDEPARLNLLLVPDKNTTAKSPNAQWNSDVGKKNRVAYKRSKINKRRQRNSINV